MTKHPLDEPCSRCRNARWQRAPRHSFLTTGILDFFHLYPWQCAVCGKGRLISLRSDRRTGGPDDAESVPQRQGRMPADRN